MHYFNEYSIASHRSYQYWSCCQYNRKVFTNFQNVDPSYVFLVSQCFYKVSECSSLLCASGSILCDHSCGYFAVQFNWTDSIFCNCLASYLLNQLVMLKGFCDVVVHCRSYHVVPPVQSLCASRISICCKTGVILARKEAKGRILVNQVSKLVSHWVFLLILCWAKYAHNVGLCWAKMSLTKDQQGPLQVLRKLGSQPLWKSKRSHWFCKWNPKRHERALEVCNAIIYIRVTITCLHLRYKRMLQ